MARHRRTLRKRLETYRGMIISAAATVTALGILAGAYAEFGGPVPATVGYVDARIAALDARSLTLLAASLRNQLYAARSACAKGDRLACDHARDLERQLHDAEAMLKKLRGF